MTITERIEQGEILVSEWRSLYREKWNGLIVPEAVVHPAKAHPCFYKPDVL